MTDISAYPKDVLWLVSGIATADPPHYRNSIQNIYEGAFYDREDGDAIMMAAQTQAGRAGLIQFDRDELQLTGKGLEVRGMFHRQLGLAA